MEADAPEEAVRQYEIWWASFPAPIGKRPVLLMSRDGAYEVLHSVLVCEITTRIRNIPQEVTLGKRDGLDVRCVANFDNLHTVARARLTSRAGTLSGRRIIEVKRAMGHLLGWPELALE